MIIMMLRPTSSYISKRTPCLGEPLTAIPCAIPVSIPVLRALGNMVIPHSLRQTGVLSPGYCPFIGMQLHEAFTQMSVTY